MTKPAIVQSDNTILIEVNNPEYEPARDAISPFAELEKSPEHIHTYRITALSLWNAASTGHSTKDILNRLAKFSRYDIPQSVTASIREQMERYGLLYLEKSGDSLVLKSKDNLVLEEIIHNKKIEPYIDSYVQNSHIVVKSGLRGHIKQALIKMGFPVEDFAGYEEGEPLDVTLRETSVSGRTFALRDYQNSAVNAFYRFHLFPHVVIQNIAERLALRLQRHLIGRL